MSRLNVTEKDRLLASGLSSLLVVFFLAFGSDFESSNAVSYTMVFAAAFAAIAFVFVISPMRRGSLMQKFLGSVFIAPLIFIFYLRHRTFDKTALIDYFKFI